jgi:TRAP-type C4-dicarboxylate transport system permease small subunit
MKELDLTRTEQNVTGGIEKIAYVPYRLDHHRIWVAIFLLSILLVIVICLILAYLAFNKPIESIQTMAEILFTPLIGLVGFVIGFYFASER